MALGSIVDIFYQWESLGLFDFVLPFLLVFALVFGILSSTRFMGNNKPVYIILAIVIGLMSLRYQYFLSTFMSELFPRLGIGLAVLLATLILVGLFIAEDEARYWMYGLAAIGVIIAISVVYQSFSASGFLSGFGYESDLIGYIFLGILIVGVIIAVAVGGRSGTQTGRGRIKSITGWPMNVVLPETKP